MQTAIRSSSPCVIVAATAVHLALPNRVRERLEYVRVRCCWWQSKQTSGCVDVISTGSLRPAWLVWQSAQATSFMS